MEIRKLLITDITSAINESLTLIYGCKSAVNTIGMFADEDKHFFSLESSLNGKPSIFSSTAVNIGSTDRIIPSYDKQNRIEALSAIGHSWKCWINGGSYDDLVNEIKRHLIIDKQLADKVFAVEIASFKTSNYISSQKGAEIYGEVYNKKWTEILNRLIVQMRQFDDRIIDASISTGRSVGYLKSRINHKILVSAWQQADNRLSPCLKDSSFFKQLEKQVNVTFMLFEK